MTVLVFLDNFGNFQISEFQETAVWRFVDKYMNSKKKIKFGFP